MSDSEMRRAEVASERGPTPPHGSIDGYQSDWRYTFEAVPRDRLVFDGDQLVGILCPGCDEEHLSFWAETDTAACRKAAAFAMEGQHEAENRAVARHWTEDLSQRFPYILRDPAEKSGVMGRRIHLPECPALNTVSNGSNYYGSNEKPEGFPECRVCFGWTGYEGP